VTGRVRSEYYMVGFDVVLSTNLEKLADRAARAVLEGSGDKR